MALEPCQLPIACVRLCGVRLLYVLRVTWAGLYAQTSSYATQAHDSGSDSDTSSSSSSSDDEREGRGMGVSDFDRRRDGMDAPREHFVIEMTEEKLPDVISVLEDLQPPPVRVCVLCVGRFDCSPHFHARELRFAPRNVQRAAQE